MAALHHTRIPLEDFRREHLSDAQHVMHTYMMETGERAGLRPDHAFDFAVKAGELLLPDIIPKPDPSRERLVSSETKVSTTLDAGGSLVGFVQAGNVLKSNWPYFHRLSRTVKLVWPHYGAPHMPRVVGPMAFRSDSNVHRTLLNGAVRSPLPQQAVIVEVIGDDPVVISLIEQAGLRPSAVSESAPLFAEYPEVQVRQFYGRSAMHASGLLIAGAPAPDSRP